MSRLPGENLKKGNLFFWAIALNAIFGIENL